MWSSMRIAFAVLWMAGAVMAQEDEANGLRLSDPKAAVAAAESNALTLAGATLPELTETLSINQALAMIRDYRYDEAGKIIESVLLRSPGNEQALTALSVIYTKSYEHAKALEILKSLMERFPNNAAFMNNAAWIYATADDPAVRDGHRAVELARQALVVAPGSYHIWSTMAEGYYITGQFEKSLEAAREALMMGATTRVSSDDMREYRGQVRRAMLAVKTFSLEE